MKKGRSQNARILDYLLQGKSLTQLQAINLFKILNLYLEPVIPETSEKIKKYLKFNDSVVNVSFYLKNHEIDSFNPLMLRIEDLEIEKLMEISKNE